MRETGEEFISDELSESEESSMPVQSQEKDFSDEGRSAARIVDSIAVKEIFKKGHLTRKEKNILRKRFFSGKSRQEVADETKSVTGKGKTVSVDRISQIQAEALSKLRKFLPGSMRQELQNKYYRDMAQGVIKYLHPKEPNRFLMIEYLADYFFKHGAEFTSEESIALRQMRRTPKTQLEEKLIGIFNSDFYSEGRGGRKYNQEQIRVLVEGVLNKIDEILGKKFK